MMTRTAAIFKRTFDIAMSLVGLIVFGWLIVLAILVATADTRKFGLFVQSRVGRGGRLFKIMKIRTMRDIDGQTTSVTTENDPRITRIGRLLRRTKIDELPQLINVLIGDMSFVGPRPDVPGFADRLVGEERLILTVRPGITGPATLRFRDEEKALATCGDPEVFNQEVLYPAKVAMNLEYVRKYRFSGDLKLLWRTLF